MRKHKANSGLPQHPKPADHDAGGAQVVSAPAADGTTPAKNDVDHLRVVASNTAPVSASADRPSMPEPLPDTEEHQEDLLLPEIPPPLYEKQSMGPDREIDSSIIPRFYEEEEVKYVRAGEVTELKLKILLYLKAKGYTQKDLAKRFGVDVRTIRRWERKAEALRIAIAIGQTPEDAAGRFLFALQRERESLLFAKSRAEHESDWGLLAKLSKLLVDLETREIKVLKDLGLFDQYVPSEAMNLHPGQGQADR